MNKSDQKNRTPTKRFLQFKTNTKKQRVIEYKIKHPSLSLKEIALKTNIRYTYVRQVWSLYKRKQYTIKGSALSPLPFTTQNFGFVVSGIHRWYSECPVEPSNNRNRQKVYRSAYYTIVFHVKGSVLIHPWVEDWAKELRRWLDTWMLSSEIDLFFDYVIPLSQKHVCIPAPGVTTGYRFKVPGVGTLTSDKTPYPSGTLEYEFDPGVIKKLDRIEKQLSRVGDSMETFAIGMEQHMKLITSLQDVSKSMMDVLMEMKKSDREERKIK